VSPTVKVGAASRSVLPHVDGIARVAHPPPHLAACAQLHASPTTRRRSAAEDLLDATSLLTGVERTGHRIDPDFPGYWAGFPPPA
jgi:hypothetical protein